MHLLRTRTRRSWLLAAVVSIALLAGSWGAMTAQAGSGKGTPDGCIAYTTGRIPPGTKCMNMPWELEEAGPGATGAEITGPAKVCATGPSGGEVFPNAVVHQTRSAIQIKAVERRPPNGGWQKNCAGGWGLAVKFQRGSIDGRRIEGESWPSKLRYGSLRGHVLGLPRLIGLAPAQAQRVLWLEGFHARVTGHGRQVVSQLPGWHLTRGGRPSPYPGVTKLVLGQRIEFPAKPAVSMGAHTGALIGAIRFDGGPPPVPGHPRPPASGVVVLFDARGKLLARFQVKEGQHFRLQLVPGRYLLIDDLDSSCGDISPHVQRNQTVHAAIPVGCDIP